jgi:hypothetical protein
MLRFTADVTDNYVAPEISKFDRAEIPDMSATQPESLDWMSSYVRSSVLRGAAPSPQREYRFSFLRRATIVYSEHGLARQATLAYLESEEQSFGKYFMAIHHWEQFLTAAWHALEALRYAAFVGRLHVQGDGSIAQRLHSLYYQTKHTEGRITSGQMPPQALLAVWLCNSGLRSHDSELTFAETGEIVAKLGDWAHVAVDPSTSPERDLEASRQRPAETDEEPRAFVVPSISVLPPRVHARRYGSGWPASRGEA